MDSVDPKETGFTNITDVLIPSRLKLLNAGIHSGLVDAVIMFKVLNRFKVRTFNKIIIQGTPKALDLSVGLRPIGSGVAMFDSHFD